MIYKFNSEIEEIKFNLLKLIAQSLFNSTWQLNKNKIIDEFLSSCGKIHWKSQENDKEIINEWIKIIDNDADSKNIIWIIEQACDKCPDLGYQMTSCHGCTSHACMYACPKNAISIIDNQHTHIDKQKCINCGLCARACPYNAITNFVRPCKKACPTKAINIDNNTCISKINYDKCISCGSCLTSCPFGAIVDISHIIKIINLIKNKKQKIYAVVAPSIASQFDSGISVNQVAEAIIQIGFDNVYEAAFGADMVAWNEAHELIKKSMLTSSCCPAFVSYIKKFHPDLKDKISGELSPMAQISKVIKTNEPNCKICFIGPCTAKKAEIKNENVSKYVDYVLTFVELRAMFAAKNIEINKLKGIDLDDATKYGRNFASLGGLSAAVSRVFNEINEQNFKLCNQKCSGIFECNNALLKMKNGDKTINYIEGMACVGGCINGPCSITHDNIKSKILVDMHSKTAKKDTIKNSINQKYNK